MALQQIQKLFNVPGPTASHPIFTLCLFQWVIHGEGTGLVATMICPVSSQEARILRPPIAMKRNQTISLPHKGQQG